MTDPDRAALLVTARTGDEEQRYRATLALEPARPEESRALVALLDDESWRVRSAAVERLAEAPAPAGLLPALVAAVVSAATVGGRDAAAAALVRLGPLALPPVLAELASPDPAVRLAMAPVAGALGDRSAVAPLAARLADADVNVRAAAAEALGRIGGAEAAQALLAALDAGDHTLRAAALEGLVALRVAPPVDRLVQLMEDRALRPAAYRTLGPSDEPAALAVLAGGLVERARSSREAALSAIGQQRVRRGAEALAVLGAATREVAARDAGVAATALAALGAEEPFVPIGALAVLGWLGDPRHAAAVARLAGDERLRPLVEEVLEGLPHGSELLAGLSQVLPELSPLGRLTVHATLAAAGHVGSLQSLVYGTGDADPQVSAEAIAALGRVGDPRAVAPLAGLLGDDVPSMAGVAGSALIRIAQRSPEGRRAVLLECRARAATGPSAVLYRTFGAVGEGEDLRLVRHGLVGGAVALRMAAAAAIASLGHRGFLRGEHVPELIAALSDPAWAVRAAAARAFMELAQANADHRLGDPETGEHPLCAEATRALLGALSDVEPTVRAGALEALGACGRSEHAGRVAELAADPAAPPLVAVAAFHALARLGEPPVAVLEAGLAHADAEVAKEAVAASVGVEGEAGRRLLTLAARSPRWDVRHAAALAMAERGDAGLRAEAARLATSDPDALVARAFAAAARALQGRAAH